MDILIIAILIVYSLYLVMILVFIIGLIRIKNQTALVQNSTIPLSVVVAVRNEEENIDALLNSLLSQNYPSDNYEIVLVDDHSTDSTFSKIKSRATDFNNISLIELPNGHEGKKQAIALGVEKAKNDLVVFTDADCSHPKSWLQSITNRFAETNPNLIIGPVMLGPANSFFQQMQSLEHSSLTASTIGACEMGIPFMASSANLAFDKQKLGFNMQMLNPLQPSGDDVFLLHSAKRFDRKRIVCVHGPASLVTSKPADSLLSFLIQRARWASKATSYRDLTSIAVALIVLLLNLILVTLLIYILYAPQLWPLLAIGFAVKTIIDLPLLWIYLKVYRAVNLLKVFIPLQLVYPFYILFAATISVFGKTKWKGRG